VETFLFYLKIGILIMLGVPLLYFIIRIISSAVFKSYYQEKKDSEKGK
jgi:hypothetical protein